MSKLTIFNDIKINKVNLKNKRFLVNCNHTGSIDDILILTVLKRMIKNFSFKDVRSVSEVFSESEKFIFDYIDSIVIDNNFNITKMDQKVTKIINNYKNMSLILFLEGHARPEFNKLMESRTNIILKNINFPKILSFELLCKKKYFDYLIDIDVIYYHKLTKKIIKGDSNFTIFLDPNIKTKIEVKTYDLPKINHEKWLLNLYKKKDYNLNKMMKTL